MDPPVRLVMSHGSTNRPGEDGDTGGARGGPVVPSEQVAVDPFFQHHRSPGWLDVAGLLLVAALGAHIPLYLPTHRHTRRVRKERREDPRNVPGTADVTSHANGELRPKFWPNGSRGGTRRNGVVRNTGVTGPVRGFGGTVRGAVISEFRRQPIWFQLRVSRRCGHGSQWWESTSFFTVVTVVIFWN